MGENNKIKIVVLILVAVITFSAGIFVGAYFIDHNSGVGSVYNKNIEEPTFFNRDVDFRMFWQVWNFVKDNYYKQPVSETALFYGALEGMVDALKDPYTVFLDPELSELFISDLEGQFEGIGAEIGIKHDVLTIISPLPDSPAERAGLRPGDLVFAIDGEDTAGISIDEAVSKIRGEAGTEVVLTIFREGSEETQDIPITRGQIDMVSVRTTIRDDGIAYIELFRFAEDTEQLFEAAVNEVIKSGADAIIVDLRGNSGGYLESAVNVGSHWIGEDVVTIERDSKGEELPFYGKNKPILAGIPTVVLINAGTASGSEIMAGALRDYSLATIIGEQSYGKGSVQQMESFKDGSAVKVTIAEWLTPNGESFNEAGLTPDIIIEMTPEDYNDDEDPQFDQAIEYLLKGE